MPESKFESQRRAQITETTLGLLDAVEDAEGLSQRTLAARLGVALGLTNALIKRCAKKGLLKVRQAPARRYAYYLTPKGFKEKSRLTAEYLSVSLNFFRRARVEYGDAFATCKARGWRRVALYGASELAEIAILAADEAGIELVAVIDPGRNVAQFCRLPVARAMSKVGKPASVDAVVVTDVIEPQAVFEGMLDELPPERILTPPLLHVSRNGRTADDGGGA